MPTVQLAGNGFGGLIQGAYGNYTVGTDGTVTVDTRDAGPLLTQGFSYITKSSTNYTLPIAPAAASVGAIVASGALSNGTVAVTAQPDVARPITVEVGTGTGAITAGSATVTYIGNDGISGTDTISLVCPASSSVTQTLSRGVVSITSIVNSGVTGGTSPWFRMSRTSSISLPVAPSAVDFTVTKEYDAGATVAVGTLTATLGSITPTTAPNGTVTYSFAYSYIAPIF